MDQTAHQAQRIRVKGLVQGVGFRPFVWHLAQQEGLQGQVLNDADGVLIDIRGAGEAIARFLERLESEAPRLSRIEAVQSEPCPQPADWFSGDFRIAASVSGAVTTGIVPDAATCPDCLAEIFDPTNRRLGYAFGNCTHCGPRLSIVKAIPYDRAKTSMAPFVMCPVCQAEYEDPADRRFHAQPNACPQCGPKVWAEAKHERVDVSDPVGWAAEQLANGSILALKGIGGFHLAADARNAAVVATLRARKSRLSKPFALMARDVTQVRRYCDLNDAEAALLADQAAPVVLLKRKAGTALPESLAPGMDRLGVMLPYSPLHHLLMAKLDGPIVLTSGNLSEEPQVIDNVDARVKLDRIADGFLMHDRDIVNRLDDSVVRLSDAGLAVLRRARGYAPAPIRLAGSFRAAPRVLALGGELKSTFCLMRDGEAVVSQHMGDLENRSALEDLKRNLELYRHIYDFAPEVIAVDRHPDYLSSQLGRQLAAETGADLVEVQHHHAHLAGCLAEQGAPLDGEDSLAILLDGSGLGSDGMIWGGELLVAGYRGFERVGHFPSVALPGGAAAIREPWRNLFAHLQAAFGSEDARGLAGSLAGIEDKKLGVLDQMIRRHLNAPLSSSAGRLFDAVAAALGICVEKQSYEGETGARLEALARPFLKAECGYPVAVLEGAVRVFSWEPLWGALLADLKMGVEPGRISARFHLALINALTETGLRIAKDRGLSRIILSGGVMQNMILADGLHTHLGAAGMEVLIPQHLPANDGGLCLGQAAVAAAFVMNARDVRARERRRHPDGRP